MPKDQKQKRLRQAQRYDNDEFYTKLDDIKNEVKHYAQHFKNKIILCNCDEPGVSNFYHYFIENFQKLELKKLICIGYKSRNTKLFTDYKPSTAKLIECDRRHYSNISIKNPTKLPFSKVKHRVLQGDGDFRSSECIAILKTADIIVTNPPFSLFQEYVDQLIKHKKNFLILGNQNAIGYKKTADLIVQNKIWLGVNIGKMSFSIPKDFDTNLNFKINREADGKDYVSFGNITWFTNMKHDKQFQDLKLTEKYDPKKYPKYDNLNAININKTKDIPSDYPDLMGVPITFLEKYNPSQFTLIGLGRTLIGKNVDLAINGKFIYSRLIIQNRKLS